MVRWKKPFTTAAVVAATCTIGGLLTGFVPADADTVNAADVVAAIQQLAPDAVADSVGKAKSTDADTAAAVEKDGRTVSVPTDAADGIKIAGGDAPAVTIGLPFAKDASDAAESQVAGVVVYNNNNGSSTVPVVRDGSVQISTVIDNANAPTRYDYPMDLAAGRRLQLNADGSVIAAGEDGSVSVYVAAPWAKDANGYLVPTHYEINGNTLTQVVDFTANTAFPVVADPTYWWGGKTWLSGAKVSTATVAAALAGLVAIVPGVITGAVIQLCNSAGKGIWVYWTWAGQVWCTGP